MSQHTGEMQGKGISPKEPFQGQLPRLPQQTQPRGAALASPELGLQLNPCPDSQIRNDLSWSQACPEAQAKP